MKKERNSAQNRDKRWLRFGAENEFAYLDRNSGYLLNTLGGRLAYQPIYEEFKELQRLKLSKLLYIPVPEVYAGMGESTFPVYESIQQCRDGLIESWQRMGISAEVCGATLSTSPVIEKLPETLLLGKENAYYKEAVIEPLVIDVDVKKYAAVLGCHIHVSPQHRKNICELFYRINKVVYELYNSKDGCEILGMSPIRDEYFNKFVAARYERTQQKEKPLVKMKSDSAKPMSFKNSQQVEAFFFPNGLTGKEKPEMSHARVTIKNVAPWIYTVELRFFDAVTHEQQAQKIEEVREIIQKRAFIN